MTIKKKIKLFGNFFRIGSSIGCDLTNRKLLPMNNKQNSDIKKILATLISYHKAGIPSRYWAKLIALEE